MTERDNLTAALEELGKVFTPTEWTTPLDLERHRWVLGARLREGDFGPYREPFSFPGVDQDRVAAALAAVERESASLPAVLRRLVREHVDGIAAQVAAVVSRDDALYAAWAVEDSGLPTVKIQNAAREVLRQPEHLTDGPRELGTRDLESAILDALERHSVEGWRVEISANMAAMASVNGALRRIRVREGIELMEREVHRLVAHEVGGHVLRWENARRQAEPLAAFPFRNTAATEEGLAALREREQGLESAENLRRYAVRVLGVVEAQRRGLVSLAEFLCGYLDADDAAELALRLRRGLADPESHGGLTKDHGYLSGLLDLAERPVEEIRLLRATKWGVGYLDAARELLADGKLSTGDLIEYVPSKGEG
ncbi:tyrosine/phenylalanine carboxypeptidase domain-containing protein [Tessaracoccus caeni]|uniref:tyrosine/phenylalanine carboxypeptidase domain-containing protein n=1 Tax=Tessaracoccus caeni TaxID=3031239 RepID=UPI0023DB37FB|nr:tyrosine/phenylalanine carboxypeptidase domain-containing protein [Tessaracoccus caeni]MDF1489341.1 DUF1704 domain-containing protein [Tessaracoccus caeni]